ncbi:hypothetical protein E2C01_074458 [Portunus trituberculatus]|uniref:Uncharacterized protein n=1 Tax=Portunus trituberculatus TaxID=210409 RepID=A0A5B7IHA9_PORTR|nr:hypothetical protein [Portunus trituberculatus]
MKSYRQNAEYCCLSQDCGRTMYRYYSNIIIMVIPVLPKIRNQSSTVVNAIREMTELCIRPNVWPFDYQIFSQLISLWC